MTDDEHAAALCSIALTALLALPVEMRHRFGMLDALAHLRDEIARLRNCTPEDIQNEFEGKGR